jgi:predicted methyltransferase
MKKTLRTLGLALFIIGSSLTVQAQTSSPIQKQVEKILAMEHRDQTDRDRDANRAPSQFLEFIELSSDMKVLEVGPGNGWYTKILAPLLKEEGELHIAYKKEWLDGLDPLFKNNSMEKTIKLPIGIDWNNKLRQFDVSGIDFKMNDADIALSIREYHNFGGEDRATLHKAVYDALKPGGRYVVVDHTRRHMQAETNELRRREDPVQVIIDVQAAGFRLEKSSNIFYRADDELLYEVGRKTVSGNTDRFTLVFVKPK